MQSSYTAWLDGGLGIVEPGMPLSNPAMPGNVLSTGRSATSGTARET